MTSEGVLSLIEALQKYDNEEGYNLSYDEVKSRLNDTVRSLAEKGESALDHLHPLLIREETWSCLFALEILREIKSERSIPYLINFIRKNEDGDYWEACEDAMFALYSIGEPSVKPLLREIKIVFENETYYLFLVGALTKIKDDRVYSFMKETLEDCIKNYEKYVEWFDIPDFVYGFDAQGKKEILPLLQELLSIRGLSEYDRIEIQDTISFIDDPEGFKQRIKELRRELFTMDKKIGRNAPCPCGSGKKYKRCCLTGGKG